MHNVFLSYAHADDVPYAKNMRGWVTEFADHLQKMIVMAGPEEIRIWMDHRLEAQQEVDHILDQTVRDSACFVAVLSPRYLASKWCRDELAGFLKHVGGMAGERVFLTEISPTAREDWHEALRGTSAAQFWRREFEETAPMTFGWPNVNSEKDEDYWRAVNDLAHRICRHVRARGSRHAVPRQRRVWIAAPSPELIREWHLLGDAIRQSGCEVHPADPGHYASLGDPRQVEACARDDMAGADLLVHLLGTRPGRLDGDASSSLDRLQLETSRKSGLLSGAPLRVWRRPDIKLNEIADAPHRELLTGAIACGFEEFRTSLVRELPALGASAPRAEGLRLTGEGPLSVLVAADQRDRQLGEEVRDLLYGLDVESALLPEIGGAQEQAEWRAHYESQLVNSDALIIVYGCAPASWVLFQALSAKKTLASNGRRRFGALLDGPPGTQPDHGIKSPAWLLVNCRDGVDRQVLAQLVARLGSAGGAHA